MIAAFSCSARLMLMSTFRYPKRWQIVSLRLYGDFIEGTDTVTLDGRREAAEEAHCTLRGPSSSTHQADYCTASTNTDHRNAQTLAPFGATPLVMAHWVHVLGYLRGMASQHEVTASTLPPSFCQLPQPTYDTSNEMFPISVTLSYISQRNPPRVLPKHAARPAREMLVILACGNGLIVVRWPASEQSRCGRPSVCCCR